jgi:hypothetical protein
MGFLFTITYILAIMEERDFQFNLLQLYVYPSDKRFGLSFISFSYGDSNRALFAIECEHGVLNINLFFYGASFIND